MPFWVDIPKQPPTDTELEVEWENVKQFETREEAIAFAKETYGADDNGNVSLVTG
jgi:hypothetical protein